jgi:hypothetical protein
MIPCYAMRSLRIPMLPVEEIRKTDHIIHFAQEKTAIISFLLL